MGSMTKRANLQSYYRKADSFQRYSVASKETRIRLKGLLRNEGRYFGRRVLDIGCGGGALGFLLEGPRSVYVGADVNPDAIRLARETASERKSSCRFILRDATRGKIPGRYDTIAVLGNTLGHFTPDQFGRLLENIGRSTTRRAKLIVEYRDVVGNLARGRWRLRKPVRRKSGRGWIEVTPVRADLTDGLLRMRLRATWSPRPNLSTHAIWSPFILTLVASLEGWSLVSRRAYRDHFVDVFRRHKSRGRAPTLGSNPSALGPPVKRNSQSLI